MKAAIVFALFVLCVVEAQRRGKKTCNVTCEPGTFRVVRPNGRLGCWCFRPRKRMQRRCMDSCPADCPHGETFTFRKQRDQRPRIQCTCDCAPEPAQAPECPTCQTNTCPEGQVRTIDTNKCVICGLCQPLTEQVKTVFNCPEQCNENSFLQMAQTMDGGTACECSDGM